MDCSIVIFATRYSFLMRIFFLTENHITRCLYVMWQAVRLTSFHNLITLIQNIFIAKSNNLSLYLVATASQFYIDATFSGKVWLNVYLYQWYDAKSSITNIAAIFKCKNEMFSLKALNFCSHLLHNPDI